MCLGKYSPETMSITYQLTKINVFFYCTKLLHNYEKALKASAVLKKKSYRIEKLSCDISIYRNALLWNTWNVWTQKNYINIESLQSFPTTSKFVVYYLKYIFEENKSQHISAIKRNLFSFIPFNLSILENHLLNACEQNMNIILF